MTVAPIAEPCCNPEVNAGRAAPVAGVAQQVRPSRSPEAPTAAAPRAPGTAADAWTLDRLGMRVRSASRGLGLHLARAACEAARVEVWTIYGYARVGDYTRAEHDRTGRWFQDGARLGAALDQFPSLVAAMAGSDGRRVGFTAATKIAAVATAETIDAWIERARRVTVRELAEEISARRSRGETAPGPEPGAPGAPGEDLPVESPGSGGSTPVSLSESTLPEGAEIPIPASASESAPPDGEDIPWGASASRTTLESEDPDIEPRVQVGFEVPRKVALAFEETLDLHRSVTGTDATVQSFVEALSAEAAAGPVPPDCTQERLQAGDRTARAEHAQARIHQRWERLKAHDGDGPASLGAQDRGAPHPGDSSARRRGGFPVWDTGAAAAEIERDLLEVEQQAESMLAAFEPAAVPVEYVSRVEHARAVHERLRRLLQVEDAIERCLGRLLFLMSRRGDFATLGFASLCHYGVERLDMPRRTAECRAAILWKLQRLPQICQAYESGTIGLESAEEIYRCVGPHRVPVEVEEEWIAHATGLQVKRLREERRRLRRQELASPEAPAVGAPGAPRPCPRPATDAEWLASLRRSPGDTRARLRGLQLPGFDDPNATLSDLCRSDQSLRLRLPMVVADVFRAALEATRRHLTNLARAQIEARDGGARPRAGSPAVVAGSSAPAADSPTSGGGSPALPGSLRAAVAFLDRERRVPSWVALLALLEDYAETHDDPQGFPVRRWDPVYEFWGWICRTPACTVRVGIEDHHIQYRSRNGSDALHNQIVLCPFHHRQGEHGDFLHVWGTAPGDIHWLLGAPGVARRYRNERLAGPQDA